MAFHLSEKWESEEGTIGRDARVELSGIVWSDNPVADQADNPMIACIQFAGPKFPFLTRVGAILNNIRWERLGQYVWKVIGEYRSATGDRQTNDASFSFNTGGGSAHILNSKNTVASYAAGGATAPNFHGLIGVTDRSVEGVHIHARSGEFKTTFYISPANMTAGYADSVDTLADHVNSDPVLIVVDGVQLTYQPGELLYRSGEGSKRRGFGDWEFTLNWAVSRNKSNFQVGPITVLNKNGWDYLWVRYAKQADGASLTTIQTPIAVYIEQVYDYAALSPLLQASGFGLTNAQPWAAPAIVSGGVVTST